jgi:hypothetical protein
MEMECRKGKGLMRGRHRWSRGGMVKRSSLDSDSSSDSRLGKGLEWENRESRDRVVSGRRRVRVMEWGWLCLVLLNNALPYMCVLLGFVLCRERLTMRAGGISKVTSGADQEM